jgi:hypothetical protein
MIESGFMKKAGAGAGYIKFSNGTSNNIYLSN